MSSILIIEDDLVLKNTITELLEIEGYKVDAASNGIEGLEIAKSKELDLVICDINMPLMNGYITIQKFREMEKNLVVPFLFLTALSKMENFRVGMDLGADDFVTKPFENSKLLEIIKRLLAKYAKIKEQKEFGIGLLKKYEDEVSTKLIDIKGSIERARLVQSTILPIREKLVDFFEEYGLFYAPKEIVSGDFYWSKQVDGKILVAVGDCTGHGIPAALMTMVCSSMLNICVDYFNLKNPKEILDRVSVLVSNFMASGNDKQRGGMDIALCSIDYDKKILLFSGANRPLFLQSSTIKPELERFKKNALTNINENSYLYRIKGGIGLIGFSEFDNYIEEISIKFDKGDQFYLTSDGYFDQFGGRNNRKFKCNEFINLIQKNYQMSMRDQELEFEKVFREWKGENEQTDDITLFFFKF